MRRIGLALAALSLTATPAFAQACRPAPALEQQLAQATTTPFLAEIRPETPTPGWNIGPWGGFEVPADGLGEVIRLNGAMSEAVTSCGHRVAWRLYWGERGPASAGQFKVTPETEKSAPRSSVKYSATTLSLTPDPASQTAWLTVAEGASSWNYLINFPATAISVLPPLHSGGLRIELAGLRASGVLVYAEFSAAPARR